MQVLVRKVGNTLVLVLPAVVVTTLELTAGTLLDLHFDNTGFRCQGPELSLGLPSPGPVVPLPGSDEQLLLVHDHANRVLGYPGRRLTLTRAGILRARMREGFTVAQLQAVATWVSGNAFLRGSNPRNRVYDDYKHMYRSAERVEEYLQNALRPTLMPSQAPATYLEL